MGVPCFMHMCVQVIMVESSDSILVHCIMSYPYIPCRAKLYLVSVYSKTLDTN